MCAGPCGRRRLRWSLRRRRLGAVVFRLVELQLGLGGIVDLSGSNRYAVLYRIHDAKRPETRARRIKQFVEMLDRGETISAQPNTLSR